MKVSSLLFLAGALAAAFGRPTMAQSTLPDQCAVVITEQVLYMVPVGQPAIPVLTAANFGVTELDSPSITWIRGTDEFLITSRVVGGIGGLWRLHLNPDATASLTDLLPAAPPEWVDDFVDATYSLGLDTAFVLNRNQGWILSLPQPATNNGALLDLWGTVTPGDGLSIVENGARWPFGVIVAEAGGLVRRHTELGAEVLHDIGVPWTAVGSNPVTGEWYVASRSESLIGKVGGGPQSMVMLDFNVSGFCGALVQTPADMEWDPFARRAVALAQTGVASCVFGGLPTGGNHLVRLPLTAGGGPPNNVPVLLTFPGESGIVGTAPDFALVRHSASDITFHGLGGTSGAGATPVMMAGGYTNSLVIDKNVFLGVTDAPPSAFAYLLIGITPITTLFQGQPIATLPLLQIALGTNAAGDCSLSAPVPNDPTLLGLQAIMQWWLQDTTTAAPGDWVSSHAGMFTVGLK
ncbi:MAG: hypothetical protein ACT4PU_05890 [Planctomycetota bacterium]